MTMRRRPIQVATVSHRPTAGVDGKGGIDRLMASAETYLVRASRMGADLIAFPEAYPQLAVGDVFHHAEPVDAGTLPRVQEIARKLKLHVVWPRIEYDPARGGLRNTAILIGRDGEILGRYDKMFPTIGEIESGCIPGTEAPSFETDFGRVGMLICFDLNFREVADSLAQGQPDVVVFPSMYRGGRQAQTLALQLGAFVVTAISAELGVILDRAGRLIKESTYETLAVAPLNTNSVALHMDGNWHKMDTMLEKYGPALSFDYHTREAFVVLSHTGPKDIRDIVEEFSLEPFADYYARSRVVRAAALEKARGG
jgi:predicted amidohydrolase